MNKTKRLIPARGGFKITITEEGFKVNKPLGVNDFVNAVLRALLTCCIQQKVSYETMYTAFGNFLGALDPAKHFPSKEELEDELDDELDESAPPLTDEQLAQIAKAKEIAKTHMEEAANEC